MADQYSILRVMNNNVILAKSVGGGKEKVLIGNGLGFGRKKGQLTTIHPDEIEKAFVTGSKNLKEGYLQMLQEVNGEVVGICTEILIKAEAVLGELSHRSFIVIVDHISFAIEKSKNNIQIENPFTYEIRNLYPEEYAIGEYARKRIMNVLDVDITEDEIGFIALHLNAAKQHKVVSEALKSTRNIKEAISLVEHELGLSLKMYPRLHDRLLLHLRGFVQRMEEDQLILKHPLYDEAVRVCSKAHGLALKVGQYLSKEKGHKLEETETFYLLLHIDRLIRKSRSI